MNRKITAIIYSYNEVDRIPYVWKNLRGFCNVIVFDGGSTDGTADFCREHKIKFIVRPKDDSKMSLDSLRWVFENTPTDYVLRVFCAHYYPKPLLDYFAKVADQNKLSAVFHDVVIYRYGKVVHRPPVRRVASCCNFFKKSSVDFSKSKIHDEVPITFDGNSMMRLPGIDEMSLHLFQDEDCKSFTVKTIRYCDTEAYQRFIKGERVTVISMLIKPLGNFVYRYFRLGSFKMGFAGVAYSLLNMIYDYHVQILLWEKQNNLNIENAKKMNSLVREDLLRNSFFKDGGAL